MGNAQKISIEHPAGTSFGLLWKHDSEKALANVIIMTGMEETSRRYDDFAKYLRIVEFGQSQDLENKFKSWTLWSKN